MKRSVLFLLVCGLIAGCADPAISVKDKWANGVKNFALVPVYPMREDVFIGDVRVHSRTNEAYSIRSRLLDHLPIDLIVEQSEADRPTYGKLTTSTLGSGTTGWAQPSSSLGPGGTSDRLRLAALPDIELIRVAGFQTTANAGLSPWTFLGFLGLQQHQTLLISLGGVETLEIPDAKAVPLFLQYLKQKKQPDRDNSICAAAASFGNRKLGDTQVSLITRVIYAREINYTYANSFEAALKLAAGKGDPSTLDPSLIATVAPASPPKTPTVPSTPATPDKDDAATAPTTNPTTSTTTPTVAAPVTSQPAQAPTPAPGQATPPEAPSPLPPINLSALANASPGMAAGFTRSTKDGIHIHKVFERPLAFGVNVLSVDAKALGIECSTIASLVTQTGEGTILRRIEQ